MWLYKSYIATDYVVKANLPDNGRWITVHPNGENESGHAVYIVPNPDGTHTVVAGAGGKLNGLQISGVKDEDAYAQESAQKSRMDRETARIQRQQMIEEQGQAAYEEMNQHLEASKSRRQSEKIEQGKSFVQAVLEAQGINANKVLEIPESAVAGLDGARRTQVEVAHVRGLVSYARDVVKGVRERVLTALETASPEVGDVEYADLIREVISPKHPGYSVSPQQMAVERGLMPTPDALEALSDESRLLRSDGDVESAARAKAFVEKLQAGAEKAREQVKSSLQASATYGSGPLAAFADTAKPVDLQDAVKLLAMEKSLRDLDKTHKQEISQESQGNLNGLVRPVSTPHAPISISEGADTEGIATSLMEDLRSRSVARLLDGVNTLEDAEGSLYGHYVRSRHETLSAIVGSHLPGVHVDPMLVDLLGGENGARLLVGALASQSSPEEMESFKEYVKTLHVKTQKAIADKAVESAEPLITEGSKPIEADLHSPESVLLAYAQTQKQRGLIAKAQQHLGQAKGQIEAGASLNAAMMRQGKKGMNAVLPMDIKDAAISCAGILGHYGLTLGTDYTIVSPKSGETSLSITEPGVAKLTPKVSQALASRIEAIHAPAPTDIPVGFRAEIDAKSPLHEVASKGTADLSPGDVGILRRYWADAQGMPDDSEPLNPLSKPETKVFKQWQEISTSGRSYSGLPGVLEAQVSLKGLPGLGSTDLDDPQQVLAFAHTHADALGYETIGDEILGLTNATPKKAFKDARKRIGRLVRGIWAHQQGAPEFDPESVPTASKLWTQAVRQQGFGKLVGTIQSQMLQDPRVTEGSGKAFRLTEGQQKARQLIADNKRMNMALGAGCVAGDTLLYDPVRGITATFEEWCISGVTPYVYSRTKSGKRVIKLASPVFVKAHETIYRVTTQQGRTIRVAGGHRFLTVSGWTSCAHLRDGDLVLSVSPKTQKSSYVIPPYKGVQANPSVALMRSYDSLPTSALVQTSSELDPRVSSPGIFRPGSSSSVRRLKNRVLSYPGNYSQGCRQYDELPHGVPDTSPGYPPLQDGAPGYRNPVRKGVLGVLEPARTHSCQESSPVCNWSCVPQVDLPAYAELVYCGLCDRVPPKIHSPHRVSLSGNHSYTVRRIAGSRRDTDLKGLPCDQCTLEQDVVQSIVAECEGLIFDLSVPDTECYESHGFVNHNSGKTNVAFATFLDAKTLHQDTQGRQGASRALMLVPSAVQGQFGSEWDRFISPEHEVTVFSKPGAGEEDRHSALAGDDVVVMTPESWRDTMTNALAQHRGETPQQTAQWAQSAPYQEVDSHVHEVMDNQGWNFDFFNYDEGHRLLGRQGKADSLMGILADSASRKRTESGELPYYISSTADMAKNDPSEVYSGLSKVDPEAFPPTPEAMEAWTRRYRGVNGELSENAGLAMRMEAMPYTYTNKVDLPIKVSDNDILIPLTPEEQGEHDEVMNAYKMAKSARAGGKRDAQAEQILGTDDPRLFALARDQRIGQVTALNPKGGRMNHLKEKLSDGVPTIVFATSREAISMMERELNRAGHRVKTLTGSDSGLRKKKTADAFQRGEFDILLASDAAEAGVNLQRAQRVVNYNVPMTEKTRSQRIARAARMGQINDVEVENLVADCEGDRKNLARVKRKGGLREIMTTPLELADEDGHKFFKFAGDVLKGGTTDGDKG